MTGNHELCMLIDGVVKRFPTAIVKIYTPYYKGTVKALCMENPVQELIVGNVSRAKGVEECYEAEVTEQSDVIYDKHEDEVEGETQPKQVPVENGENEKMTEVESVVSNKEVVINPDLSSKQQDEVRLLLREYKEIFSDVPKVTNLIEHTVELTQIEPRRCKAYPTPYKMQEIVDMEIDDLLEVEVIERSEAPYASPLILEKKRDNTYRVCVNFKELNKVTVFDPEPMMSPDDIFPRLAGSKIYSSFDFCKGYYGIPMQEESKDYTTFVCSRGLMRFKVYGMVNSGSTYNRMTRKLLDGSHNLESYVDDVLGYTENWSKHMEILRDFF